MPRYGNFKGGLSRFDRRCSTLAFLTKLVISGFNTDVEFGGVTYHIQTEDKGLETPIILSLVYDRGTILAAKRQPYDDLVDKGFDEKVLADRLNKQHKTICAAIKKGRIQELKAHTDQARNGKKLLQPEPAFAEVLEVVPTVVDGLSQTSIPVVPVIVEADSESFPEEIDAFDELASPIPMPKAPVVFAKKPQKHNSVPVIENALVIDLPEPLPFEAVRIVSDLAGMDRPESSKLGLELIGDDTFYGGTKAYVTVMVCRGSGRKVVAGAEVMVKLLGSSFRPLIFHSQTDNNGITTVGVQIPSFHSGRASILVRAINKGEEVEVRRPIIHG